MTKYIDRITNIAQEANHLAKLGDVVGYREAARTFDDCGGHIGYDSSRPPRSLYRKANGQTTTDRDEALASYGVRT